MITADQRNLLAAMMMRESADLEALSQATREDRAPVELDQQSVGRLSRMDAIQQQSMDIAREERRLRRLKIIKAALQRIDDDDYGYCLKCADDISFDRLSADPAATLCKDCMKS